MRRKPLFLALLLLGAPPLLAAEAVGDKRWDDAAFCSHTLQEKGDNALPHAQQRRCMIAIIETYVQFEEAKHAGDKVLLAPDVWRNFIGVPIQRKPDGHLQIRNQVVPNIIAKDRAYVVEGNQAWLTYEGRLQKAPDQTAFWVTQRFTVEKGVIRTIEGTLRYPDQVDHTPPRPRPAGG